MHPRKIRSWVPGPDAGTMSVALAGVVALAVVLLLFLAAFAAVLSARHQAQSAADLAALAGAQALRDGGDPCATASRIARAQASGAVLLACQVRGWEVQVEVRRSLTSGTGRAKTGRGFSARARAGPPTSVSAVLQQLASAAP